MRNAWKYNAFIFFLLENSKQKFIALVNFGRVYLFCYVFDGIYSRVCLLILLIIPNKLVLYFSTALSV